MTEILEILDSKSTLNRKLYFLLKERIRLDYDDFFNHIIFKDVIKYNENNIDNNDRVYECYMDIIDTVEELNIVRSKDLDKYSRISNFGIFSNSTNNIKYWSDRGYSLDESKEIISNKNSTYNIENIMIRHNCSEDSAKNILQTWVDKRLDTFDKKSEEEIKRINYEKGKSTRREYILTQINPNTGEKYTDDEISKLFKERYGWSRGTKMSPERLKLQNTNIGYYMNKGHDSETSLKLLSERQSTFSLSKCIEKHGEIKGRKIWQKRQDKWIKTMDSKPIHEKLKIFLKRTSSTKFYSRESISFFENLIESFEDNFEIKLEPLMGDSEYFINTGDKFYMYDFTLRDYKIAIEYNGTHVHPCPNMSIEERSNWKQAYTKESADVIAKRDNDKINAIKNRGYDVLIVYDNEVNTSYKRLVKINEISKYLYNKIKNK